MIYSEKQFYPVRWMTNEAVCCKNRIQGEPFYPFPNNHVKYRQHHFQYLETRVVNTQQWYQQTHTTTVSVSLYKEWTPTYNIYAVQQDTQSDF